MSQIREGSRTPAQPTWLTVGFVVGLVVTTCVFLFATGVSLRASVGIVIVVGVQASGGAAIWQRLRVGAGVLEIVGMGLALGTALSVVAGLVVRVVFDASWGWMLPSAVVLVVVLFSRVRGHKVKVVSTGHELDRASRLALSIAVVVGAASLVGNIRHYPLSWDGLWGGYHPDMPFFEALSTSLAKFGPFDSIFLPGAEVRYHWLAYAWSGQISETVGAPGFVMLTRGLQLVAVLASSLLIIAWTRRLTHRLLSPTLAVLLLLSGGYIGITYGGILNFDSPSQSMGVVWLLAVSLALITFVQWSTSNRRGSSLALLAVIAALGFATTGGKISAAAPAVLGAALMASVGIAIRADWARRALYGLLALFAGSLLAYALIISGANGGGGLSLGALIDRTSSQQGLNPLEGSLGVVLGTAILAVGVALRWSGVFWLESLRENRRRPDVIFAVGLMMAGMLAIVLFNGFNEIWFATAACAPLAVFTAEGFESAIDRLVERCRHSARALVLVSLAAAVVISAVVWELWLTGPSGGIPWNSTLRWTSPFVAIMLGAGFAWLILGWAGLPRNFRYFAAALTIVLVLVAVPGRLLGIGSGQVGQPASLRPDLFSFGIAPTVRGHDEKLFAEIPWQMMESASWLREQAAPYDLLATNLTFGPLIPAITGMQTFASGVQYQAPYGRPSTAVDLITRDDQIWKFVNSPAAATFAPLCEAGVKWIWVDPHETDVTTWEPFASVAYSNPSATILRVVSESCP